LIRLARQKELVRCLVPILGLALLGIFVALYTLDPRDYYRALASIGVPPFRYPFLDWEYITAGIKCWNIGINVYITDPCDVLHRAHSYSPLWLRAVFIPTERTWTTPIGIVLILGFLLSLFWIIKPVNWQELIIFVLACMSPTVIFALERGNVDVIIFAMLVVAGVLSTGPAANRILSYALILIAGLLKFYPLIVLSTALRERARCFFAITAAAGVVVVGLFYLFREELAASLTNVARGGGFGSMNLPLDGPKYALLVFPGLKQAAWFPEFPYAIIAVLLIVTAAQVIRLVRGNLASALEKMPERDTVFLVIGAALIAGCFFTAQNIAYRGIYLIFVAAGFVAMRRAMDDPAARAMLTRAVIIVVFLMWAIFFRQTLLDVLRSRLALYGSLLLWLLREILWWRLVALLLAVLVVFGVKSELFAPLRRRHVLQRED
jgi:hypothetical protein